MHLLLLTQASEEEAQAIKERIIAARRKVHKTTGEQVAARWTFEEGVSYKFYTHISERTHTEPIRMTFTVTFIFISIYCIHVNFSSIYYFLTD